MYILHGYASVFPVRTFFTFWSVFYRYTSDAQLSLPGSTYLSVVDTWPQTLKNYSSRMALCYFLQYISQSFFGWISPRVFLKVNQSSSEETFSRNYCKCFPDRKALKQLFQRSLLWCSQQCTLRQTSLVCIIRQQSMLFWRYPPPCASLPF